MHLLDCKGVAGIIFGSLLCYLVSLASVGANIAARLQKINEVRVNWCTCNPGILIPKILQNGNLLN